jgi:hypothetical protein
MTEPPHVPASVGASGPTASPPVSSPQVEGGPGGLRKLEWGQVAIGLAGVLLLIAALVGTAPLWAPVLPWGTTPAPNEVPPAARAGPPQAAQPQSDRRNQPEKAAANAALERLDQRLGALEAKPAVSASDIADVRQQMTKLSSTAADLAARVETIGRSQASRAAADTALIVTLLQIRDAVAAGRPFAVEYEAFARLASAHPEIATAAAPLAGPAKTGVAGHAVLAQRLRGMAGAIAAAKPPAASTEPPKSTFGGATDWAGEALSRLRGLVTIRRIGDAAEGAGPEAVVGAAERALASGDLDGAVAKLDGLSGAPAEAARPWLRMAKERLAVKAALNRIESVLVTRLGAPPAAPADSGSAR